MAWTEPRSDFKNNTTETKTIKVTLDKRLYTRMLFHKIKDAESLNETVAKAICHYLGLDEKDYDIPSFKDAKLRSARSLHSANASKRKRGL